MFQPRFSTLASLAIATALVSANMAWAADRESRPLNGPVSAIALIGPVDIEVRQGEFKDAEVEASDKLRARVVIENQGGELRISLRREDGKGLIDWARALSTPVRVRLVLPSLDRVSVKGSGDVTLGQFDLKQADVKLEVTGSGDIRADHLQARSLNASILGSGDIRVGGSVDALDVSIAGSGDFSGEKLRAATNAIAIKGSGDATVWATDTLAVSIFGSGDVRYAGQPKVTQTIRGSGEVKPIR